MFEFYFKRKVLLKIVSITMTVSLFLTMGFSNCLAVYDDVAMIYGEYVIDQLEEISLGESIEINSDQFWSTPIPVRRYDDKPITNKKLIDDEIIERDVYKDIENTVEKLMSTLDEKTDIKKAAVIYEWVARNIKYDYDSANLSKAATQNAFCAFKYNKSMCDGFSKLLQIMMHLAGVRCKIVMSHPKNSKMSSGHAFNAIYLKDGKRTGWTLLDSTWASCGIHDKNKKNDDREILKRFFPALDKNRSLKESNKSIMCMDSHQVKCIKDDIGVDGHAENFGKDAIMMSLYVGHLRLMYIPHDYQVPIETAGDSDDDESANEPKIYKGYIIKISDELSKFKTPIFFRNKKENFKMAETVVVDGNVEIDFDECDKKILREIKDKLDFTRSNKYEFDENNKNIVVDKTSRKEVFNFSKI